MTYRYGEASVRKTVEGAVNRLVAIDVLSRWDEKVNFSEDSGTQSPSRDQLMTRYREEAEKMIQELGELTTI